MVVGYLRQYAYLIPRRITPNYTQGPGFNPKPEILIPIRVSEIDQVIPGSSNLLIVYNDGSDLDIRFYPIGGDQSGVELPGGSSNGMETLFWDWVASINKGVPTPTLDKFFQNAVSDSINNTTANTFLQIICNQDAGPAGSTQVQNEKFLRLFRKDVGQFYGEVIPAEAVYGGEISQYSLIDPSLEGKWKWLQLNGEEKEITYSVPANLNMDLNFAYYPGVWDFVNIQVIIRSVIIDGEAARLCLQAMTKINFQNTGTVGQGPGVEWTLTYNNGVSSTAKLEYEYFLEDGSIQGGTENVPRLSLRIPDSEAVPGTWEDFAFLNGGFGTAITNIVGPNFDEAASGDDIWANALTSAINNLNNSNESVATFTGPEGFDITNLT
tara:strand:- start:45 stop:1187 length:1143 start_codon:yes stop_codon:yes gene_type:complete